MSQTTKHLLTRSLKQMLRETKLEKITIGELAEHCGINRKTFYYHFGDIYGLIDWAVNLDFCQAIGENDTYDTWQTGYLNVLKSACEGDVALIGLYETLGLEQAGESLSKPVHELLCRVIDEKTRGMKIDEKDRRIVADFYEHAIVGVTLDWLDGGMEEDPEYIASRIGELVNGNMIHVLENLRKDTSRRKKTGRKLEV